MAKMAKIGVYGTKTRRLQSKLSYERTALTQKTALVYKYLRPYSGGDEWTIPDPIFLEVRDRVYDEYPYEINIAYEQLGDGILDLTKFGIISPLDNDVLTFRIHVNSFTESELGRFIVVGDVFDIPFLSEDFGAEEKHAYFEVTDVDTKNTNETFFVVVSAKPLKHSQETIDVGADNNEDIMDILDDAIEDEQEIAVPLDGFEGDTNRTKPTPHTPEEKDFFDSPTKVSF